MLVPEPSNAVNARDQRIPGGTIEECCRAVAGDNMVNRGSSLFGRERTQESGGEGMTRASEPVPGEAQPESSAATKPA